MPAASGVVVVPVDALARMGGADPVGPEIAAQDVGIGLGGILVLRAEGILPDTVLAAVAAGVGVADEFNHPLPDALGLEELSLGLEGLEDGAALFPLGPFLDDQPVRLGLALLLLEQDEGGVPVDDDNPVRLCDGILVDPDIEVIPSAVPGLQGQVAAGEGDAGIDAAPVKGDGSAGDEGTADKGDPAVGGRNFLPGGGRQGQDAREEQGAETFHIRKIGNFCPVFKYCHILFKPEIRIGKFGGN